MKRGYPRLEEEEIVERERDRRPSNQISKAQLMYTISRGGGSELSGKKRGMEREGWFPARLGSTT